MCPNCRIATNQIFALSLGRRLDEETDNDAVGSSEKVDVADLVIIEESEIGGVLEEEEVEEVVEIPSVIEEDTVEDQLNGAQPAKHAQNDHQLRDGVGKSDTQVVVIEVHPRPTQTVLIHAGRISRGDSGPLEVGNQDVEPELLEDGRENDRCRHDSETGSDGRAGRPSEISQQQSKTDHHEYRIQDEQAAQQGLHLGSDSQPGGGVVGCGGVPYFPRISINPVDTGQRHQDEDTDCSIGLVAAPATVPPQGLRRLRSLHGVCSLIHGRHL